MPPHDILLYILLNSEKYYFKNHYTTLSEQDYNNFLTELKQINDHYKSLLKGEADHTLYDDVKDKLYLSLLYKKKKDPTEENNRLVESLGKENLLQYPDEDPDTYEFLKFKERSSQSSETESEQQNEEEEEAEEETKGHSIAEHENKDKEEDDDDDVLFPDLIDEIFNSNFMSKDECSYVPGIAWTKKYGEIPVTIKKLIS